MLVTVGGVCGGGCVYDRWYVLVVFMHGVSGGVYMVLVVVMMVIGCVGDSGWCLWWWVCMVDGTCWSMR